jgi:uncharacterized protein YggE
MKRIWILPAVMALASVTMVAAVCGSETTRIDNGEETRGITVTGEGKLQAPPDVAQIILGVSVLAPTVGEARDRASTSLDAMLASLRGNGVDDDDLQTQQLSISPEYDYSREGVQTLRGFRVSNTLTAKIRDIDTTGKAIDDAVDAGGDAATIQGIMFTIDDPAELRSRARELAVEDARAKAETLARASGVGVGSPVDITEGSFEVPIYQRAGAELAADRQAVPSTPIEPGELDVVSNVTVTWEIS